MRKFLSLLLAVVMLCSTFTGLQISSSARTSSGSCGNGVTYTFDESTCLLTINGSGNMDNYEYGESPFYNLDLESVLINSGVTSIGDCAFIDCENLKSVIIENTVESIGAFAFTRCYGLTSITIPDSVTRIGENAFDSCSGLKNVIIGNSVTNIGDEAFIFCGSLTSVTIGDSVTRIGENAFASCSSLKSIIIPKSVLTIDFAAFCDCGSLEIISIPKSVTNIDSSAFCICYRLTDVYYAGTEDEWNEIDISDDENEHLLAANIHFEEYPNPDSDPDPEPEYEYIEHGFLPVNSDSVSVNLAEHEIHQFFIENPGEYEITISGENKCDASLFYIKGNGSEYIDRRYGNDITLLFSAKEDMLDVALWLALEGEGNVEVTCRTIKTPTSIEFTPVQEYVLLQEAGSGWFNETRCYDEQDNLTNIDIYYYYYLDNYSSGGFASGDKLTLEYEDGTSVTYTFAENHGWQDDDENIFTGYLEINDDQDSNHWAVGSNNYFWLEFLGVKSNLIPVTIIENKELEPNFKHEDGSIVRYIGSDTEVTVPATLGGHEIYGINPDAFALNKDITSVKLPDSVNAIGDEAFRNCSNLKSIYFSYDLGFISYNAFSGCDNLKDIYFYGTEDDWNNIEISEGNESLQNATVHFLFEDDNLCGNHVNYNFDEITGILTLTGRGATYDYSAGIDIFSPFYNNNKIKKVIVSEGINYIGQDLFYGCSNLKSISLPSTMEVLGQGCFWDCSSLESIFIPKYVYEIGYYAFIYCTALKDVYYPGSESEWNKIDIGEYNECLLNANLHLNTQPVHTHEYVGAITTPATCTELGVMTYTCICGETYTDVIPATGHKSIVLNAVEPTCTKTGLTEGEKCSVCGEMIKAQNTINALGHDYTEDVTAPTCTQYGYTTYTCSRCWDSYIGDIVPVAEHSFVDTVTEPTTESQGYTVHTCKDCGYSYVDSITDILPSQMHYIIPSLADIQTTVKIKSDENEYSVTAANGVFELDSIKGDVYRVYAKQKNSLTVCVGEYDTKSGEITNDDAITFPLGDVNGDDVIDIADLSLLLATGNYGQTNSELDLTGDGLISIDDISTALMATNYSMSSVKIV